MKLFLTCLGSILLLGAFSGCVTFNDSSETTAEREDINILREDVNRIKGNMETVQLENQRMAEEIRKLRDASTDKRDQAALQERLDNLERQIQAVNAAREKDKQAIVDQLSAKIAEIMKPASRPATPRPATPATPRAGAGEAPAGTHIVKAGETLSTIAAIYKVKASAIIEANDLKDPDNLKAGQKLVIPK